MEQTIKLELTVSEVNTLLAGLAKMPYETSADVIMKVRAQAVTQLMPEGEGKTE